MLNVGLAVAFMSCTFSAQAAAALPVAPRTLLARPSDLAGFGASLASDVTATRSPFAWAHGGEGTWTQAQEETSLLERLGFQEGVRRYFLAHRTERGGRHPEAVSEAAVFPSDAAAEAELTHVVEVAKGAFAPYGPVNFAVPGIPRAQDVGNFIGRGRGGNGNVLFAVGRCFVVVGDFLPAASTSTQINRAPLAAAHIAYRRARQACIG